ncbi:MAG TPA: phytoene/squalene synthase family protein [Lysobacter sp.]
MSDSEATALASFTDKWRARWPEWAVAEAFVPHAHRATAVAWAALLQELTDAAWGGDDPRPGEAKLAWWIEELQGWAQGRRRHPLGSALQRQVAPWAQLAATLPSLRDSRERAVDFDDARGHLEAFASAIAAVESGLFAGHEPVRSDDLMPIVASLLQARLEHHPGDAVPLRVLAQAGEGDATSLWGAELLLHWPLATSTIRPRRLWAALARARLQCGNTTRPLPSWRALWVAWRGARGA